MKKALLMVALLILSVFLGGFLSNMAMGLDGLGWLGEEYSIGFSTFDLDLYLMVLTLGFTMKFNIAEIVMLLIALIAYPKLSKQIFG